MDSAESIELIKMSKNVQNEAKGKCPKMSQCGSQMTSNLLKKCKKLCLDTLFYFFNFFYILEII